MIRFVSPPRNGIVCKINAHMDFVDIREFPYSLVWLNSKWSLWIPKKQSWKCIRISTKMSLHLRSIHINFAEWYIDLPGLQSHTQSSSWSPSGHSVGASTTGILFWKLTQERQRNLFIYINLLCMRYAGALRQISHCEAGSFDNQRRDPQYRRGSVRLTLAILYGQNVSKLKSLLEMASVHSPKWNVADNYCLSNLSCGVPNCLVDMMSLFAYFECHLCLHSLQYSMEIVWKQVE